MIIKRLTAILLILVLTPTLYAQDTTQKKKLKKIPVYYGPGEYLGLIGHLKEGTIIKPIRHTHREWMPFEYKGKKGWIKRKNMQYLRTTDKPRITDDRKFGPFELTEMNISKEEDQYIVLGRIHNTSEESYHTISFKIICYDGEDKMIQVYTDQINSLDAGETKVFKLKYGNPQVFAHRPELELDFYN